jgi:D-amino-acid oxidase
MNSKNVLVLGEGVTGLSTALRLLQAGHKVTVLGEPAVLSPKSYAICVPYMSEADPRVVDFSLASYAFFKGLAHDPAAGITLRKIIKLFTERREPWWASKVEGYRHPLPGEIPTAYPDASVLVDWPVIDPITFLPWLREQVVKNGGVFITGKLAQWSDCPEEFGVIANCTGLGAKQLVNDPQLGDEEIQIVRVKASGPSQLDSVFIEDEGPYRPLCVVPHHDYLAIGATINGPKGLSPTLDLANARDILERCAKVLPGFAPQLADVESTHRVRRPTRAVPRVEIESVELTGRTIHIAHNYGAWGLAYCLIDSALWLADAVTKL